MATKKAMSKTEFKATLREVITKYNKYRTKWIKQYGTAKGYDAWFTQQVKGK